MHAYGDTDLKKHIIRVNRKKARKTPMFKRPVNKHASRYPDVLDTIVHEELHAAHPKMRERTVRKRARKLVKKLRPHQKRKLYNRYRTHIKK